MNNPYHSSMHRSASEPLPDTPVADIYDIDKKSGEPTEGERPTESVSR